MGILRLLNFYDDPTAALRAGIAGDSSNIDFNVQDIYGGGSGLLGLPPNLLASSFAKLKDIDADGMQVKL